MPAAWLVEWLNKRGQPKSKRRVTELLRDIDAFYEVSEPVPNYRVFEKKGRSVLARMLMAKGIFGAGLAGPIPKELRQRNLADSGGCS